MSLHITNLRRGNGVELTDDIENGPYYYGNIFTVWLRYFFDIGGTYSRGNVGKQTLTIY
jgi:hypothetical protein